MGVKISEISATSQYLDRIKQNLFAWIDNTEVNDFYNMGNL